MSKEKKFNDFVSYKNEKIVFCQDGRIFLIDKDTELVDLRDCENCKQKDQRIAELEKENKTAVKEFAEEVDKLLEKLKSDYSHICKTQKEANQETCRYEGVCRVQNELNNLLKEKGIEEWGD